MNGRPTISVLIPAYNRASFLPGTLRSVFAQTIPVDEVILVDDGSTDNTAQVIESLLVENPDWKGRLQYLHQENQGKSVALNNALKIAKGKWLAFLDSDDSWLPDKLEWQFRALEKFPECRACFTSYALPGTADTQGEEFQKARQRKPECFHPGEGPLGKVQEPSWLFHEFWPGIYMQSLMVRADVMRDCGEFDPRFLVWQDVDFLFRLGLITSFCYVDMPLLEIHREPGRTLGLMTNYPARSWARMLVAEAMFGKWLRLVDRSDPALRPVIRHRLASAYSALANRYVLTDDLRSARRALLKGIKECFELRLLAKWLMTYGMPPLYRWLASKRAPTEFLHDGPYEAALPPEQPSRAGSGDQAPPVPAEPHVSDDFRTGHLQHDLEGRSVRAGVITLTSQIAQVLIQTVSTVILARLLTPADFGLVAMVTAVTGVAVAFADLGLSEATIQRKEINHRQISTLFWINVGIGLGLMLLTVSLAPVLAWFYREPRLWNITLLLSLTFLISGLRVQHNALLKRQMRFKSVAIRDVLSYAVAIPLAIAMAWRGAGYWAIVALPLILNSTQMALSWVMVNWRPGLPRRDAEIGSMVSFGSKVAGSYVFYYLTRNLDNVLVGWYWGPGPLGLYSRAYNLLMLPLRLLTAPVAAVAVPAFSRVQDDPERYARFYLGTASLLTWISAPLFGFLAVAAEPIIVLTLGDQWRESAPVFRILAISAVAQPLFESSYWLFVSSGKSGRLFKVGLTVSPIIVGSFVIGLPFGIKGVALSYSIALLGLMPWVMKLSLRETGLTLERLGRALLYPVALSISGVLLGTLALRTVAPKQVLAQILVIAAGFAAAFVLATLIPVVRKEISASKTLLAHMRWFGQTLRPVEGTELATRVEGGVET